MVDRDPTAGLDCADKGLFVHPLQPAVRIDRLWHGGQERERRAGHTRRSVATGARLVGTLVVVMRQKDLGDLSDLLAGAWQLHQQAFLAQRAMKPLDNSLDAIDKTVIAPPEN